MIKKVVVLLILLLCASISAQVGNTQNVLYKSPGAIKGFVIDSLNKRPVEYATIMLYGDSSKFVSGAITDIKGLFI